MSLFNKTENSRFQVNSFSLPWGAIFSGVLGVLMAELLLNLLGAGIGLSIFSFKPEMIRPLSATAFFWFMLVGIISVYLGSWIAGCIASSESKMRSAIYGTMVAGISTLISLLLMLTTMGALFTSSLSILETVISFSKSSFNQGPSIVDKGLQYVSNLSPEASRKLKNTVPDLQPIVDKINEKAGALLPKNVEEGEAIKTQLNKLIQAYLDSDDKTYEETKKELANKLIQATGEKPEEVNKKVEEWYQIFQNAKEKAAQMTEELASKTASILSRMALVNFFILLSTFFAAIFGAIHGSNYSYSREF